MTAGGDARPANLVIAGASVLDGTGTPAHIVDVEVTGDRISAIRAAGDGAGSRHIDARGFTLAPGFIDIHSHADYTLLVDGRAESALLQGITSVVTGNCGHGIAPCPVCARPLVPMNIFGWRFRDGIRPTWDSFGSYLEALRKSGVGVNIFPLVAHGALRLALAGFDPRPLTPAEKRSMRSMVCEALQEGAVGFSTGLEYAPGISADLDEIATAAEPLGDFGGLYATHCRNRTDRMADAAREAVAVASWSGARLQMSHFVRRPYGPANCDVEAWDVLDRAVTDGVSVRADVFPFDYGPTPLAVLLPADERQGSREAIAERLQDRCFRERVVGRLAGMFGAAVEAGLAEEMFIACDGIDGRWQGATLGRVAREFGCAVPEAALRLLADAGQDFYTVTIVERWVDETDLRQALIDPRFLIMGDGATAGLDGPLHDYAFSLSDWGYIPAFLGHYVRDLGLIDLPSAVAKLTSGPAEQIGLSDRGRIAVGCKADLVAFRVADLGTTVTPASLRAVPAGIDTVIVNGAIAVERGKLTGIRAGRVGQPR